ncbi:shikimate dehydrogenase [Kineothrix alysoides]|uniref:Shikimate dehydrogenase (NADP(+)) n=1 Tax=Kineothrix alysoides TaxID=1469948 RepID=A0A4V6NGQ4_9FIRM|nr:shikimate dehydrogenase [Kineothrix alysoides]TCL60057.1 shikimate dehydrogenase [Kineothrix alysoides]
MRQIDGYTRTCGLIGNPVEHTMSPMIHNTLAEREGRNLAYMPFHVENGNVKAAIEGAYALNILGLNVTVPYKSEVMKYLAETDETAQRIGAVNTLVRTAAGYKGYNTDMPGLYRAMCSEGIRLKDEHVILLGAGGAARAVAFMCVLEGAKKVYILNRTLDKANQIASEVNRLLETDCVTAMEMRDYASLPRERKYLAIQATSVGLYPNVEDVVIQDKDFFEMLHTGFDLIYRPANTKFMSLVKEAGGQAFHGLKMLLYQGVIAYELWNDISVTEEDALIVYEKMKAAMGIGEA